MILTKTLLGAASLALVLASSAQAASLIGDSVEATYLFPDIGTVYENLGTAVVGASTPTFPNIIGAGVLDVDITGSQIIFNWYGSSTAASSAFNGLEFTDLTHAFTSASLDAVSNTPGAVLSFASGNVYVNLASVSYQNGENITINVSTGVPEPSTWVMMLLGFAGLGFAGYRQTVKARAAVAAI